LRFKYNLASDKRYILISYEIININIKILSEYLYELKQCDYVYKCLFLKDLFTIVEQILLKSDYL